jgi:aerobic C4-dicarboxylate transport protein
MSEARAITNLIGNGVATIVVAKSEKEFDYVKHDIVINRGTVELIEESVSAVHEQKIVVSGSERIKPEV